MSAFTTSLAAASRDPHLTLRRVERQQHLVAILCKSSRRRKLDELAIALGVAPRTIGRDIQRLRHSGVPIDIAPGRTGGAILRANREPPPVLLDLAEIAALLSSLAALGPTASEPADSALRKLTAALFDAQGAKSSPAE